MTAEVATQTGPRRRTFGAGEAGGDQYEHEVLEVARVVRVVKGGRRFRFRATVIVGDRAGMVGIGTGKSKDVQQAIQKGQDQAVKNAIAVDLHDGTIAHTTQAKHKGALVMLKPTRSGTGVIAGGTVRMVADLAGISDLIGKRFGSNNRVNNALATVLALQKVSKKGLAEKPVAEEKTTS